MHVPRLLIPSSLYRPSPRLSHTSLSTCLRPHRFILGLTLSLPWPSLASTLCSRTSLQSSPARFAPGLTEGSSPVPLASRAMRRPQHATFQTLIELPKNPPLILHQALSTAHPNRCWLLVATRPPAGCHRLSPPRAHRSPACRSLCILACCGGGVSGNPAPAPDLSELPAIASNSRHSPRGGGGHHRPRSFALSLQSPSRRCSSSSFATRTCMLACLAVCLCDWLCLSGTGGSGRSACWRQKHSACSASGPAFPGSVVQRFPSLHSANST